MKRTVRLYEVRYNDEFVKILVERYDNSNQYPTDLVMFDLNSFNLLPKSKVGSLNQIYINQFIYGILGREGSLSGDYLAQQFNDNIPSYDLSIYEIGEDLELEFSGFILIQDTSVVDTKSQVLDLVNSSDTVDEIVNGVKEMFDLVDSSELERSELSDAGRTPGSVRPSNMKEVTELFSQYLSNPTYAKANFIEFEVQSPITDFISDNEDTELMSEIRDFYSAWDNIEVIEKVTNEIVSTEVYPVSDPNMYLKVGDEYVNVLPSDIEISTNGEFHKLLQAGPTLPRVVANDGVSQIDLTIDNLKLLDSEGNLVTFNGVQYRSASSGVIGSDLYFKLNSGEFTSVVGLSKSLAMFKRSVVSTSKTIFRFYFK